MLNGFLHLPVSEDSTVILSTSTKLELGADTFFTRRMENVLFLYLLHSQQEGELRWVVRDCLLALKEEGWTCQLKGMTDLAYLHTATEESRSFHPYASKLKVYNLDVKNLDVYIRF